MINNEVTVNKGIENAEKGKRKIIRRVALSRNAC